MTIMCSISLQTCVLIILVVSVNGDWEKIGERIYNKISKFLLGSCSAVLNLFLLVMRFILISESGIEHSIKNGMKWDHLLNC